MNRKKIALIAMSDTDARLHRTEVWKWLDADHFQVIPIFNEKDLRGHTFDVIERTKTVIDFDKGKSEQSKYGELHTLAYRQLRDLSNLKEEDLGFVVIHFVKYDPLRQSKNTDSEAIGRGVIISFFNELEQAKALSSDLGCDKEIGHSEAYTNPNIDRFVWIQGIDKSLFKDGLPSRVEMRNEGIAEIVGWATWTYPKEWTLVDSYQLE